VDSLDPGQAAPGSRTSSQAIIPLLRATEWEFRHRFWILAAIYALGFFAYFLDPQNVSAALLHALHPAGFDLDRGTGQAELRAVFACGAGLVVVAAWVRTWATAYLTADVVHDQSLRQDELVADGPYRHVRNPLYLGLVLMAIGLALFASRLGAAFLVIAAVVFSRRLIGLEEDRLLASAGESYRAYLARVPRLLPTLLPRLPPSRRTPHWGDAVLGESFVWIFAAAAVALAITLDLRWFALSCGVGVAIYLVAGRLVRRPSAK
jgi:protein-S-isoprenylcysteine O-methyltransferase Ste14